MSLISAPPATLLTRLDALSRGGLRRNAPLAPYASFRIGGPADYLVIVQREADMIAALDALHEADVAYLLLGGGSNMLISDLGVRGVALLNQCKGMRWPEAEGAGPVEITVEGGAPLAGFARESIRRGLAGLSWAVSIPGTVGGAVVGNAGAHGGAIASIFVSAQVWRAGRIEIWGLEEMDFAYRRSRLKTLASTEAQPPILLTATFRLRPDVGGRAADDAERYIAHRRRTQPTDKSAGSIFKNPPGDYAGRLIEAAGLKGRCVGDACISEKHANFIVNQGRATAADVLALMNLARREVWQRFHILLEPEILFVGDWPENELLSAPVS
ncbi:MAG TPA: UDP-N-acetylmuramate dehydrogenase [Anaerolineae bacterium]|nr:UDP-N-acetylmuramate dehydrogenase [Anaerolineae bacterium]HIQ11553.1 UDP-N-acetylmuramate dehydrogenase [Caldilineales bacterium]